MFSHNHISFACLPHDGDCFIIIEFNTTDGDLLQGAETPNC